MKKAFLLSALCSAMQLMLGCHKATEDVQPAPTVNRQAANYDVLADATGHWQWKGNAWCCYANYDPKDSASVGYGRQLRFRGDSTLLLRRTGQADAFFPYRFVVTANTRLLVYATHEPLPTDGQRSIIMATKTMNGRVIPLGMILNGQWAPGRGSSGWSESYLWVAEP